MVQEATIEFAPEQTPAEVTEVVQTDALAKDPAVETVVTEARPEGLPENFKSVAEMAQALADTKAKLTQVEQGVDKKPDAQEAIDATADKAKEAVEKSGVDFNQLSEEYNSKGELSEDTYKNLSEKGFPKEVVDAYIEGQKLKNERFNQEMYEVVGGEQTLDQVLVWAQTALSKEEISAYNSSLTNPQAAKLLLAGIYAKYAKVNGAEPNLIDGNRSTSSSDVFKSAHDMTLAMQDKRYWSDPDYQNEVRAKAERSQLAGII